MLPTAIKTIRSLNSSVSDTNVMDSATCIKRLKQLNSYRRFQRDLLPESISSKELKEAVSFLSPSLIIIRGSYVSQDRYSPTGSPDLDIIVVSYKKNFWTLSEIYNHFRINVKGHFDVEIDLAVMSPYELARNLKEDSTWLEQLKDGFTLIGGKYDGDS